MLIYSAIMSLDGYTSDDEGKFDWAEPDEEVLAFIAICAGLVDEYQLFVTPVIVGGGTPALPSGTRAALDLADERRFASGVVCLRYRLPGGCRPGCE